MPSKQLIAYATPGDTWWEGGGPDAAHRHRLQAHRNAAFAMENVDTVFMFFFNRLSPRRWQGRAGARLFAITSGLLFTVDANALQKADPFSKKKVCFPIEKLLVEIFGLLFLV